MRVYIFYFMEIGPYYAYIIEQKKRFKLIIIDTCKHILICSEKFEKINEVISYFQNKHEKIWSILFTPEAIIKKLVQRQSD